MSSHEKEAVSTVVAKPKLFVPVKVVCRGTPWPEIISAKYSTFGISVPVKNKRKHAGGPITVSTICGVSCNNKSLKVVANDHLLTAAVNTAFGAGYRIATDLAQQLFRCLGMLPQNCR